MSLFDDARLPVAPHLPLARRLARRYHCPDHSPQDLEQEAALALLEALARHGPDPARLTVAVRAHLSRVVRSAGRHARREVPLEDVHAAGPDPSGELAEVLEHARARLPGRQVDILSRTAAGESDPDIAAALGITPGRVRRDRSRAIISLRAEFAWDKSASRGQ